MRTTKAAAVKTAAARSSTTAKKPAAAKSTTTRTTAAKTAAAQADAAKSAAAGPAKATAAKTAAAKATAAKTAAAKAAASRAASTKTAAKKTASKTAATKTAAAQTAAAKKTAARKEAAKAAAAAKDAAAKDAAENANAPDDVAEIASAPAKRKPRSKSAVAADDAAPTAEAVSAPVPIVSAAHAEAPVEEAPVEEALVEESLVEEAPVEETPVEEAPVEETPVEEEASVALDTAAEAVTDTASTDAAPVPDAVVIRGMVKEFGDHRAVNGIDLTIPAGSFYGIVGPNGAGKTTTLSILAGLLRADAGQVVVSGIDQATDALGAKRVMGVLPDRLRTFDRLTGRQLLHYYGLLRGLSADVIEKRSADLVRAFDLADSVGRVVSDYSAGMTKKIMLAGAMIHSPRVLVLDEPFEAVDPVSSAVILDILRSYVAHGGTVILSSHGMDLVERVCSRVAIIVDGDVLAEGTIDEVRAGQTLESRFVELSGGIGEVEGLEWLHTFSD